MTASRPTQMDLFASRVDRAAWLSDDVEQAYRYMLSRTWGEGRRFVNFVMLNPSTADAEVDDPTIVRCMRRAAGWGFDGLTVTNLFAFRSTDPAGLKKTTDPIGPLNDDVLIAVARDAACVVCGWGAHGGLHDRARAVRKLLESADIPLHHLGLTKGGHPGHPLFLPYGVELTSWTGGTRP